uniref:Uncharacterized protein n=1 Tax=Anguilla anguilla TaxID=7936 RepID=A0A0E9QLH5_ANGAN
MPVKCLYFYGCRVKCGLCCFYLCIPACKTNFPLGTIKVLID